MRITFINSCPYLGGAELWHLRTAVKFVERGHRVTMLARPGPLAERAAEAGVPVVILPLSFDLDLASAARGYAFFRRERPEVILLNDQRETRLIAPAARAAGVKVRVQRKGWPFLKGSWRDRLVYRFFVTHLIANSDDIARLFRDKGVIDPTRITVMENGVDLGRFRPGDRDAARTRFGLPLDSVVIGSVGRLVSQKGFQDLIAAGALLRERGREVLLAIAGEGEMKEELEQLSSKCGTGLDMKLMGQVEDTPEFLRALDVFAFPSHSEGRSNALLEAMAMGLPIAAGDIPGNRELIEDGRTGLIFPIREPEALADKLEQLLAGPEAAAGMGRAAQERVKNHFDQERALDRLIECLQGLIDEAAGRGGRG
jgi:glycosyltransferase involved in cell wall biosynthesis